MSPDSLNSFRNILQVYFGLQIPPLRNFLIWTIAIATVIGLTVHNFVPLILEYRSNNVATQVNVVLLDDRFKPPQMVLALPRKKIINEAFGDDLMILAASLYANDGICGPEIKEICENLKNASWDVWSGHVQGYRRTSLSAFYGDLSLAFTERIFMNPISEDFFDHQFSSWNGAVISSFLNYVGWVIWSDYNLSPTPPNHDMLFNQLPPVDFQKKFENYDIKLDLLYSRMLKFLCSKIKYSEYDFLDEFRQPTIAARTCSDLLLNATGPVYVAVGLTFALPAIKIPTIKEYRFEITHDQEHPLEKSSDVGIDPLLTVFLYADAGSLYASNLDQSFMPFLFASPTLKRGSGGGSKITVKYKVQMRARETRSAKTSCLNGTSATSCFSKCTKLWVIEKCKCVPFIVKKGLVFPKMETTPYCDPMAYAKCNITVLPKEISDYCMGKCKQPCDSTIYSWQIGYDRYVTGQANVTEFIIKMVPQFDTFAEFTWIVKDTPEQFYSQLAGIGSFYLGVSGLSVASLIIWCMDRWNLFRKRQADTLGSDRKGKQDKNVGTETSKGATTDGCKSCGCGRKRYEEWPEIEAKLQAKWREDMEDIIEKYGIKKPSLSRSMTHVSVRK